MEKTKIAIIGCGKQATKHTSGLKKIPGVELVLHDIRPERARGLAEQEEISWVENVSEIFGDPEMLAVDICTPTSTHVSLIRQAVTAGKDFICEKPLCEDVKEACEVREMVSAHGRIGMVGYVYRYAPVFKQGYHLFRDVPRTGESMALGRIVSAFFRLGGRGSHQVWKHRKDTGGGAINEMLVHLVDLAIWYFGRVKNAKLLAKKILRPQREINGSVVEVDAEDYVLAQFSMESGVEVVCQADLLTPAFSQFVEIQGLNGTFKASIQPEVPSYVYCERAAAEFPEGKTVINFGAHNLFEAQMVEFVRAIHTREQPAESSLQDTILLIDALNKLKETTA